MVTTQFFFAGKGSITETNGITEMNKTNGRNHEWNEVTRTQLEQQKNHADNHLSLQKISIEFNQ
jgi:hypothetical protein